MIFKTFRDPCKNHYNDCQNVKPCAIRCVDRFGIEGSELTSLRLQISQTEDDASVGETHHNPAGWEKWYNVRTNEALEGRGKESNRRQHWSKVKQNSQVETKSGQNLKVG